VLATLVATGIVAVWHVVIFALISGVGTAFDVPIRQSFNREMVEMEDLPSAIALNSTAFNTARVAGPAVAGVLIGGVGLAECFFINAFSFVAIIVGLLLMRLTPREVSQSRVNFAAISEGVLYVKRHETLRLIMMLVAVVSFGAMSFGSLMPVFARDIFHTDARGFSLLMTCNGLGALAAAASLSVMGEMRHKGKRLLLGAALFCLTTFSFALAPNLILACSFLILSGFFLLTFLMTANTLVQTLSPDAMRGRIFSLYSLSLIGASPLGAIAMGAVAKGQGARAAVGIGTLGAAMFVGVVFWKFRGPWKQR
jgi:MFS family permease